jgi:hypothetical protein
VLTLADQTSINPTATTISDLHFPTNRSARDSHKRLIGKRRDAATLRVVEPKFLGLRDDATARAKSQPGGFHANGDAGCEEPRPDRT